MADRVVPGPVESSARVREAVCIRTRKIFDSCKDKDCIEDLRVYLTTTSQSYIENAFSVRPRAAKLLYTDVNVEALSFNRGYYTVDVTYYYQIFGETAPGNLPISGLAVFDKRVMLFGSEGCVKSFSSDSVSINTNSCSPIGVVEAVDPLAPGSCGTFPGSRHKFPELLPLLPADSCPHGQKVPPRNWSKQCRRGKFPCVIPPISPAAAHHGPATYILSVSYW